MEEIRKNKLFIFVGIILIVIVSLISEIIIKDYKININKTKKEDIIYKTNDLELNDFKVDNNNIISQTKKSNFIIKLNKKYVDKFSFKYKSKNTVKFKIIIKGYNSNNKKIKKVKELKQLKNTSLIEKRVGFKVKEIKVISYDKNVVISDIKIDNTPIFNIIRLIVIMLFLSTLFVVICYKKFNYNNIAVLYFIIATLIGSAMIIASPCVAQVSWDEAIHYRNTNNLFRGLSAEQMEYDNIITSIGISIPETYEENKNIIKVINESDTYSYDILIGTNVIKFDNIIYIPMSLARRGAEIIGFSPSVVFYIGKIVSLIIFVLIISYSIYIAKVGKTSLFVLGLIPITIFQAISYSRDGLIIAGITLSTVAFVNIIVDKKSKVDFKSVALFVLPLLMACLGKPNYFPLFLLALFIPKDRFKNNKQKNIFRFLLLIITLLVVSTFGVDLIFNNSNIGDIRGVGHISVPEQINVVLHNPIGFINIFIKNFLVSFFAIFSNHITTLGYLGNSSYSLGYVFVISLIISLFVKGKDEIEKPLDGRYKLLILFVLVVIIFGINLALYLEFTAVGSNYIDGVQFRYYLPLLYSLFVCLMTNKIKSTFNYNNVVFVISLACTIALYVIIFESYICNVYW